MRNPGILLARGFHEKTDRVSFFRRHATAGWLLLFIPTIVLYYWKILLTDQFSLLTGHEGVNQAYSWLRFWIYSVRHWTLPIWDPYSFAGRSFAGEMQTAAFYPLHLVLALFPLNDHYVLSPYLYNAWWAGAHMLGAWFMFLLVREFGLSRFAAFVAGNCFVLGGFVGALGWPHMLESSIWLPAIVLFFLRAVRAEDPWPLLLNACIGGLALGMSILAGGFHAVIMQVIVVVSAGIFHGAVIGYETESPARRWLKSAAVVAVIAVVGFAAGAVQLLPSIEYSARSVRWLGSAGALPANQKIPYEDMTDAMSPRGVVTLLLANAFNGSNGEGEVANPYLGVFPLIAAIVGIRRNWRHSWVRYLTGLAIAAVLYSFGEFSWLNGVLYAVVPKLWMAREAPRMLYLADFSLAILAAFGIEALLAQGAEALWPNFNRTLTALVAVCAACLIVPGLLGKPDIGPWASLSIVLIFASYALLHGITRGGFGPFAKFLVVGLILFDLGTFNWTARGLISETKAGTNFLNKNMNLQGAVNFLKTRPAPFRVQVFTDPQPNIGDLFGIPSISGAGVIIPADFMRIDARADLLNVRYVIRPASAPEPGPIYQDGTWKVYENASGLPRAWVVHETMDDSYLSGPLPAFDPSRTAVVNKPLTLKLAPAAGEDRVEVMPSKFAANKLELRVHAQSRGLLVLSETYYPGWRATVNGTPEEIYQVDGDLRGVIVPAGDSDVGMTYAPVSVYAGGGLGVLAFAGTLLCWMKCGSRLAL